jgi:hypothetical protein
LKVVTVGVAAAAMALPAGNAGADTGIVDPTYGRIEGDMNLAVGAGAVIAPRGPRGEAEVRLRYLETAGVLATYEDAFGSPAEPQRALTMGLEVRPLFLFRWLKGHEGEHPWFDLALDSMGFEMGVVLQQRSGAGFASQRGIEVALGIELPLMAHATGAWIGVRGGLRWSELALASGSVLSADDRQATLAVTLAWHQILPTHIVDLGDRAVR